MTRLLSDLTVLVPADATEAYQAVIAAAEVQGPVYLRLGRHPTPVLFGQSYRSPEAGTVRVSCRPSYDWRSNSWVGASEHIFRVRLAKSSSRPW